ncbi:MAG: diaminopimelate epimerase [Oscillospiraceae bacterium]|nr:diaminopimelate epimerase [Oscillospiraceae bacterium]
MQFWKMNGAGNDFIVINNIVERIPADKLSAAAKEACDRRYSVGADGFIVVDAARGGGDFRMEFYNSDGSVGEMCGNGARCVCRYAYENGLAGKRVRVETGAGLVTGERVSERIWRVKMNDPTVLRSHVAVEAGGETVDCAYVELGSPGSPHAVVEVKGLDTVGRASLFTVGRALRSNPAFPKGANVNFFELTAPNEAAILTYERGVENFTLACGTGSCSTAAVLAATGRAKDRVTLHNPGGDLVVEFKRGGERVYNLRLTGPADCSAKGELIFNNCTF